MSQNVVVVTTDLSETSAAAIAEAILHAKSTDAEVHVILVSSAFELPLALQRQLNDPESLRAMKETYEKEELERLEEFLKTHAVTKGVTPIVRFSDSKPSELIVDYAKEVDARLIVMASQGKGALGRFFLGSNTQRVVAQSTCPVLIIPPIVIEKHEES